jgi:hypothetical protein
MLYRPGDEPRALVRGITEFCQRYGLLGLLPHRTLLARLGGRREFLRTAVGWRASAVSWEPEDFEPPETVITFDGDELAVDDAQAWHDFFRGLPAARWQQKNPPLPPSEAFWDHYQEPVTSFIFEARAFASAVELLAEGGPSKITELHGAVLDRDGARARLRALMAGVSPALRASKRGHRLTWESPSLLGHLAMQAAHDLVGDRRTVQCEECPESFSTGHWRARFCSPRCSNRNRQRAKRERDAARSRASSHAKAKPALPGRTPPATTTARKTSPARPKAAGRKPPGR